MNSERKYLQESWPLWRIIFTGLNGIALVLSVMLSWHFLTGGQMAGCGGGSPCDNVLNSRWSTIGSVVPISGIALGTYFAMLFVGSYIGTKTEMQVRLLAWKVLLIFAGSIIGGAIWFIILQKWFIGEFCMYCMSTHIAGILISALIFWQALKESGFHTIQKEISKVEFKLVSTQTTILRPLQVAGFGFVGLILAGFMAVAQVGLAPALTFQDGQSQEKLSEIDYQNVPLMGSSDAPVIVTLLFDYQCSHCHKIHFLLQEAVNRYNGKLAIALCPTPLNTQCNKYIPKDVDAFKNSCELAKTGLAVWKANPEKFAIFENWMFTYDSGDRWHPRSYEAAKGKAIELVGQQDFDSILADPWIDNYMQSCVRIFGRTLQNGKGGIPKLIYNSRWVIPEPDSADDLIRILQESLGIPAP